MELQKVKTAAIVGSQHHTEGLGPGGLASELREQPLAHTEGYLSYTTGMQSPQHLLTGASSGHVMPIMADLGPVQSLGSFILPSERFGATTSFSGSVRSPPGTSVGMRSSGPALHPHAHGPGPPPPIQSSPGRYSSDSITSAESKYPMYQY